MNTTMEEFEVIGISIRTTNQDRRAEKDIGALWHRFYSENIISKIPGKLTPDVYCLYTRYETDHTGAYTTLIGCRVGAGTLPTSGLEKLIVKKDNYEVFISEGPMPDAIQQTWMKIWNSGLRRSYTTDFDLYVHNDKGPDPVRIETWVAVR